MRHQKSTRDLIKLPEDPSTTSASAKPVKRSKRRVAIMSALATGWLPWGIEWHPALVQYRREFILCCGHVMGVKEAQSFVDCGLLTIGTDQHGGDGLVITESGRIWLQRNW